MLRDGSGAETMTWWSRDKTQIELAWTRLGLHMMGSPRCDAERRCHGSFGNTGRFGTLDSRREVYTSIGQPVFFTVRASRDLKPFAEPKFAAVLVNCLLAQRAKSGCELVAYCVMPDHFHVVVVPAETGASSLSYCDRLKGWSGFCLRKQGWTGPLWQPRSYDHAVRRDEDLM